MWLFKEFLPIRPSGKDSERQGLTRPTLKMESGNLILVKQLDRLGRNIAEMVVLIQAFDELKMAIHFLDAGISIKGTMVVTIMAAMAQAWHQRILERTNEGCLVVQKQGLKFGRKRTIDRDKVRSLRQASVGAPEIARKLSIGRSTVYKLMGKAN